MTLCKLKFRISKKQKKKKKKKGSHKDNNPPVPTNQAFSFTTKCNFQSNKCGKMKPRITSLYTKVLQSTESCQDS